MDTITNETTIATLIQLILDHLEIKKTPFCNETETNKWIGICKKNLVYTVGHLRRLSTERLGRLDLPVLLEEEMNKIIVSFKVEEPLFNITVKDEKVSVAQEHIQNRDKHYSLNLTPREFKLLRESWSQLLSYNNANDPTVTGVIKFSKYFYPLLFKKNPAGERLFKGKDTDNLSRVLLKMMGWIIHNLDNMPQLVTVLAQMGGRHQLYGVENGDFATFAVCIADSLRHVLGSTIITSEVYNAWKNCIVEISTLIQLAGKQVKMGFRGEVMIEKGNRSWRNVYLNLTLDTIYIFRDSAFTDMRGQYSIRGVDTIEFPNDPNVKHCFELVSRNPPFSLKFGTQFENDFNDWVFELEWRIQAIHREFSDSYLENESKSESPKEKRERVNKRNKKRYSETATTEIIITGPEHSLLSLSERQISLVKEGWRLLLETESNIGGSDSEITITRFFDEFYKSFFEVNPSGKRLFQSESMATQGKALIKMLAMIVKSLDETDTNNLNNTLRTLGGRHEIYGVEPADFIAFSNAMCDTLEVVLGKNIASAEMKDAWFKALTEISGMMQDSAKKIKQTGMQGVIWRRLRKNADWKKTTVSMTLDAIFIYKDDKTSKIRSSYPLNQINSVQVFLPEHGDISSLPTPYGFVVELSSYRQPEIYFCCETHEYQQYWMEEISWRAKAANRVYNIYPEYEASEHSESDVDTKKKAIINKKPTKSVAVIGDSPSLSFKVLAKDKSSRQNKSSSSSLQ